MIFTSIELGIVKISFCITLLLQSMLTTAKKLSISIIKMMSGFFGN